MRTLGRNRVRTSFNPSNNSTVDEIKNTTADLIDICHGSIKSAAHPEAVRCWDLAMIAYEEAAMWAVKAATFEPPTSETS